jgi:UDP-3-O-[3-hydroxymyristoyl] glucosamine N-acyltransferase
MSEPRFFAPPRPLDVAGMAALTGAAVAAPGAGTLSITGVAAPERAGPADAAAFGAATPDESLRRTRAGVCLVTPGRAPHAPAGAAVLEVADPEAALAAIALALQPDALRPHGAYGSGIAASAMIHPTARLEADVSVDPGAVIGPGSEIGAGTVIGANAVIGAEVRIGRLCSLGPGASLTHALVGDRVVVHAGARIGEGGLAVGPGGRRRGLPPLGRVVIQDDVHVGAGCTIDRGALRDTVIGEGARIDSLVRVGREATVGRHCIVAAQSVIGSGALLADGTVVGAAQAG